MGAGAKNVLAQEAPTGGIVKCGPKSLGYAVECGKAQFFGLIHDVIQYGIWLGIIAVGFSVVFSGFLFLTAGGSAEKLGQGKKAVFASVTGLVIALTAWLIVNTIITMLTDCSGWSLIGEFTCN